MIDLFSEQLIPLAEVPKRFPSARAGKRLHLATVYRWAKRGLRGVRLEAVRLGGVWMTSTQAVQRFADRLTGEHAEAATPKPHGSRRTKAELADEELDALGL